MSKNELLQKQKKRLRLSLRHLTEIAKFFIPYPEELSGYHDPDCPPEVRRIIDAADTFWKKYGTAKEKKREAMSRFSKGRAAAEKSLVGFGEIPSPPLIS